METSNVGCPVRGRPVSTNVTRECPAPCAPRAGRSGQTGRPAGAVSGSGNQPGTLFVACCTGFRGGGSRRAGFTFTSCLRSELTRPHPTCHTTRAPAQPVAGCTVIATKAGSEGNGAPNQSPTRCRHFTLLTLYVTQSRGSQAMSAGGRCDHASFRLLLRLLTITTSRQQPLPISLLPLLPFSRASPGGPWRRCFAFPGRTQGKQDPAHM